MTGSEWSQKRSDSPVPWLERWRHAHQPGWFDVYFEPLIQAVLPHLSPCFANGGRLVHVGSGIGDKTDAFRRLGAGALGLEISPVLLARARQLFPETEFMEADAQAMPLADQSIDAVFSFSLMQCLDWRRLLAEVRRVLRPGGRAVFIENLEGSPIARGYRLGKRILRSAYHEHQSPRDYVAWREREAFSTGFRSTHLEAFHLTTPILLALPVARRRLLGEPELRIRPSQAFSLLSKLDSELLARIPGLSAQAWKLVVRSEL